MAATEYFMASACTVGKGRESNRELHAATRLLVSRGIALVHLRSFGKRFNPIACTRVHRVNRSEERRGKKKKKGKKRRDRKMDEVSREKLERAPFGHYFGYITVYSRERSWKVAVSR